MARTEIGVETGLKMAAFGTITGTALTGLMFHKAHQKAKKENSWKPYALAAIAAPATLFYGGMAGAILRGYPLAEGVEIMAKAPVELARATIQYGPKALIRSIKLPFQAVRWLHAPINEEDVVDKALKLSAWFLISGTVAAGSVIYKVRQEAKKRGTAIPRIFAGATAPITFVVGGIVGSTLKALPITKAIETIAQGSIQMVKLTMKHGPEFLIESAKFPYYFTRWLVT